VVNDNHVLGGYYVCGLADRGCDYNLCHECFKGQKTEPAIIGFKFGPESRKNDSNKNYMIGVKTSQKGKEEARLN